MVTKDTYLSIFIIIFSVAAYVVSLPYPYNSAYFPRFIIIMMGLLGVSLLVKEVRARKRTQMAERIRTSASDTSLPFWRQAAFIKVTLMIAASILYVIVLDNVGFFSTTLVYLPVMIRLLGVKKVGTIVISTGGVVFFIYLIFGMFLRVPFPEGLLF